VSNLRNRTRILYFRVSEDEFELFQDLCRRRGARNMSDMMRSALEALVRHDSPSGFEKEVAQRLEQLESSVARLNLAVGE
jgi:hypothetical protein